MGIEYLTNISLVAANKTFVPVAIHLDHGTDFNTICLCIKNGFTSVMIDASRYVIDENIRITKKIVELLIFWAYL